MEVSVKDFTWAQVANYVYTVSKSSSEIHEQKIFMIILHYQSQLKNVESSGIWTHTFGIQAVELLSPQGLEASFYPT